MKHLTSTLALGLALALLAPPALPCTAFFVYRGGKAFAGNNEDYWDPDTKVWFVPAEGETLGRVYFGYRNQDPQGGMNTAGLFFDGFATAPLPVKNYAGKEMFEGNLIDHAMATCKSVPEVVALLERYDLRFLENAMLMFADQSGDSVIVEGDVFLRKEGDYQITTNFYQSRTTPENYTCGRWKIARRMLEKSDGVSVDLCRRILAATHVEGKAQTLYSNVYDLDRGLVYLYHFHDFENVVVLDLAAELEKGARTIDLPSLFPETFAHLQYVALKKREVEEEKERRRARGVEPRILDALAGSYDLALDGGRSLTLEVRRREARLFVIGVSGEEAEILPAADYSWFYVGADGNADYEFHPDDEGKITGLTLDYMGRKYEGKRTD